MKPNIQFAMCHDLVQHLDCDGQPTVQPPNLDRLAGEGVRLVHSSATAPQCSPSRAAGYTRPHPQAHRQLRVLNGLIRPPYLDRVLADLA